MKNIRNHRLVIIQNILRRPTAGISVARCPNFRSWMSRARGNFKRQWSMFETICSHCFYGHPSLKGRKTNVQNKHFCSTSGTPCPRLGFKASPGLHMKSGAAVIHVRLNAAVIHFHHYSVGGHGYYIYIYMRSTGSEADRNSFPRTNQRFSETCYACAPCSALSRFVCVFLVSIGPIGSSWPIMKRPFGFGPLC